MEDHEVYTRLNSLEREMHTLVFRMSAVEEDNLTNRVLSLEESVTRIRRDTEKMEATAEGIKSAVESMRSWGLGFVACLSVIVVIIGLLPVFMGFWK